MTVIILSNTDGNKTPYDAWFPNAEENIILFERKKNIRLFNIIFYSLNHLRTTWITWMLKLKRYS